MENAHLRINYVVVNHDELEQIDSDVIVETPVSLTVNGNVWLTFMCTPSNLDALAIGFLFNEGFIKTYEEVESIRVCPNGRNIDIWLNHKIEEPTDWRRTSGCTGGLTTIDLEKIDEIILGQKITTTKKYTPKKIYKLTAMLFDSQSLYKKSGGVHTSALANDEEIFLVTEDIGRHNTLDKIAGRMIIEKIQLDNIVLLTTGRISADMLQKAARIRSPLVISRTSPSSLAIALAEFTGITIIGYSRRSSFRIYTHPDRIEVNHSK